MTSQLTPTKYMNLLEFKTNHLTDEVTRLRSCVLALENEGATTCTTAATCSALPPPTNEFNQALIRKLQQEAHEAKQLFHIQLNEANAKLRSSEDRVIILQNRLRTVSKRLSAYTVSKNSKILDASIAIDAAVDLPDSPVASAAEESGPSSPNFICTMGSGSIPMKASPITNKRHHSPRPFRPEKRVKLPIPTESSPPITSLPESITAVSTPTGRQTMPHKPKAIPAQWALFNPKRSPSTDALPCKSPFPQQRQLLDAIVQVHSIESKESPVVASNSLSKIVSTLLLQASSSTEESLLESLGQVNHQADHDIDEISSNDEIECSMQIIIDALTTSNRGEIVCSPEIEKVPNVPSSKAFKDDIVSPKALHPKQFNLTMCHIDGCPLKEKRFDSLSDKKLHDINYHYNTPNLSIKGGVRRVLVRDEDGSIRCPCKEFEVKSIEDMHKHCAECIGNPTAVPESPLCEVETETISELTITSEPIIHHQETAGASSIPTITTIDSLEDALPSWKDLIRQNYKYANEKLFQKKLVKICAAEFQRLHQCTLLNEELIYLVPCPLHDVFLGFMRDVIEKKYKGMKPCVRQYLSSQSNSVNCEYADFPVSHEPQSEQIGALKPVKDGTPTQRYNPTELIAPVLPILPPGAVEWDRGQFCCGESLGGEVVQCSLCEEWSHLVCLGLQFEKEELENDYVCDKCALASSSGMKSILPMEQQEIENLTIRSHVSEAMDGGDTQQMTVEYDETEDMEISSGEPSPGQRSSSTFFFSASNVDHCAVDPEAVSSEMNDVDLTDDAIDKFCEELLEESASTVMHTALAVEYHPFSFQVRCPARSTFTGSACSAFFDDTDSAKRTAKPPRSDSVGKTIGSDSSIRMIHYARIVEQIFPAYATLSLKEKNAIAEGVRGFLNVLVEDIAVCVVDSVDGDGSATDQNGRLVQYGIPSDVVEVFKDYLLPTAMDVSVDPHLLIDLLKCKLETLKNTVQSLEAELLDLRRQPTQQNHPQQVAPETAALQNHIYQLQSELAAVKKKHLSDAEELHKAQSTIVQLQQELQTSRSQKQGPYAASIVNSVSGARINLGHAPDKQHTQLQTLQSKQPPISNHNGQFPNNGTTASKVSQIPPFLLPTPSGSASPSATEECQICHKKGLSPQEQIQHFNDFHGPYSNVKFKDQKVITIQRVNGFINCPCGNFQTNSVTHFMANHALNCTGVLDPTATPMRGKKPSPPPQQQQQQQRLEEDVDSSGHNQNDKAGGFSSSVPLLMPAGLQKSNDHSNEKIRCVCGYETSSRSSMDIHANSCGLYLRVNLGNSKPSGEILNEKEIANVLDKATAALLPHQTKALEPREPPGQLLVTLLSVAEKSESLVCLVPGCTVKDVFDTPYKLGAHKRAVHCNEVNVMFLGAGEKTELRRNSEGRFVCPCGQDFDVYRIGHHASKCRGVAPSTTIPNKGSNADDNNDPSTPESRGTSSQFPASSLSSSGKGETFVCSVPGCAVKDVFDSPHKLGVHKRTVHCAEVSVMLLDAAQKTVIRRNSEGRFLCPCGQDFDINRIGIHAWKCRGVAPTTATPNKEPIIVDDSDPSAPLDQIIDPKPQETSNQLGASSVAEESESLVCPVPGCTAKGPFDSKLKLGAHKRAVHCNEVNVMFWGAVEKTELLRNSQGRFVCRCGQDFDISRIGIHASKCRGVVPTTATPNKESIVDGSGASAPPDQETCNQLSAPSVAEESESLVCPVPGCTAKGPFNSKLKLGAHKRAVHCNEVNVMFWGAVEKTELLRNSEGRFVCRCGQDFDISRIGIHASKCRGRAPTALEKRPLAIDDTSPDRKRLKITETLIPYEPTIGDMMPGYMALPNEMKEAIQKGVILFLDTFTDSKECWIPGAEGNILGIPEESMEEYRVWLYHELDRIFPGEVELK
ncbi:hypothetical protein BDR26DRAFT_1009690 [Obelidium mucronatum]|nr:hypothetical protein BDR26DRAFT_1009690 [Obelidium mucronatum]